MVSPPVTGHQAEPGRAVALHPDPLQPRATGVRAGRQRVASSVPDQSKPLEPPTTDGVRPLAELGREDRKRLYERLRHDYRREGLTAAQAAAKRGVPLADTEALWVTYADRYGAQPNGDHPPAEAVTP